MYVRGPPPPPCFFHFQLEVQKLQAELAEYEEEFSQLKNQVLREESDAFLFFA